MGRSAVQSPGTVGSANSAGPLEGRASGASEAVGATEVLGTTKEVLGII